MQYLIGLLAPLFLLGAVYKIQSDNLLVGTETGGEKSVTFQTGRANNPKIYIDQATPDSLRFSEEALVFGDNATDLPTGGYSILFQQRNEPDHALPGFNYDGTKLQMRNVIGDVWDNVATGYGLTRDQNKFLDDSLRVDSRTDVPITDFGTEGHFLWKIGARSPNLSDYQTGTTISHGNSSFPVLYGIVIKDNFTILRFEDAATQGTIAATLDTQVPIAGYKRYAVTFPARADIGTYVAIVSEGQAEKYSFTSDLVINRDNLSQDLGQSIGGGSPQPGNNPTNAHTRFVQDLGFTLADTPSWVAIRNHPNYRPYLFTRLAAAFWGEDNTSGTISNYFDDVTGVVFNLAGGNSSATFGHGTGWNSHPSFATNALTITNSATGQHGGVDLFLSDFLPYGGTTRWLFPSVGLTSTSGGGRSARITNFNTEKRFDLRVDGASVLGRIVRLIGTINESIEILVGSDTGVGTLTLRIDGTTIGTPTAGRSSTQPLNDDRSTWLYEFENKRRIPPLPPEIDSDSVVSITSSLGSRFKMYMVNPENTVRFGEFDTRTGGPFENDYRRAIGFDFRLTLPTGNEELLVIGGSGDTADFGGGDTVSQQTVLGYDELGTYLMQGQEDGSNVADPPEEISYMQRTASGSPRTICKIIVTGISQGTNQPIISNNCMFNLTTPTNGTAKIIAMMQFVNPSLSAEIQSLPVTRLIKNVTIGTDNPVGTLITQRGFNVTMPYNVTGGATATATFSGDIHYTGAGNNVSITLSPSGIDFLKDTPQLNNVYLQISLVSAQDNNRTANNSYESSRSRIWTSVNENQTQSVVLWFHPEDNQSPDEADPYLTVRGEIGGRGFHFDLNRRASDFDFSQMKFGNSAIDVSHIQVYNYEYVQNRVTDIYHPNDSAAPDNMYEHINSWIGNWNHPTEDVGEFIIDDNVRVTGEFNALGFIRNSFSEQAQGTRIEFCNITVSTGLLIPNSGCDSWVTSTSNRTSRNAQGCISMSVNFQSDIWDNPAGGNGISCFLNGNYDGSGLLTEPVSYVNPHASGNRTSFVACNAPIATLVCMGRR